MKNSLLYSKKIHRTSTKHCKWESVLSEKLKEIWKYFSQKKQMKYKHKGYGNGYLLTTGETNYIIIILK